MLPIYTQKNRIKLIMVVVALIIGAATVIYTNILVKKLSEREQELIDLYAKALRFMISTENVGNLTFIQEEIIDQNKSIPVILTDEKENVLDYKNIRFPSGISEDRKTELLQKQIATMKGQHQPILVEFGEDFRNYIFYRDSNLLSQLRYYPYVQLTVIGCFALMAYFAFSYSRKAEQNRVWVGLAKETAHQLGTPLSSLMAWYEYMKTSPKFENEQITEELGKDVRRLEIITERFSNIGSVPTLKDENIMLVTHDAIGYLENRVSKKIEFNIESELPGDATAKLNIPLYEWVIENICKNAIDAMEGKGSITVTLSGQSKNMIAVDIQDTGKGIPKGKIEDVFLPGYTTKKRGWGLGLALARRIIELYHKGRLFIKWSEVGKGTTFRILLPR